MVSSQVRRACWQAQILTCLNCCSCYLPLDHMVMTLQVSVSITHVILGQACFLQVICPSGSHGPNTNVCWAHLGIWKPAHHPLFPPPGVTACASGGQLGNQLMGYMWPTWPLGVHHPLNYRHIWKGRICVRMWTTAAS